MVYRISNNTYLDTLFELFQGMIQGNGIASSTQIPLAILLVSYLNKKKLVTQFQTPITKILFLLAAKIFTNDTNLKIESKGNKFSIQVVQRVQVNLNAQNFTL